MKKTMKAISVVFALIVLIVLSGVVLAVQVYENTSTVGDTEDDTNKVAAVLNSNNQLIYKARDIATYNNLYCVNAGASLDELLYKYPTHTFQAVAMADIKGNTATFYNCDSSGNLTQVGTTTNSTNNVMAGIFAEQDPDTLVGMSDGHNIYKGYGKMPISNSNTRYNVQYTVTQGAVHKYYHQWYDENACGSKGWVQDTAYIYWFEDILTYWKQEAATSYIEKLSNSSTQYNAKIYFLQYVSGGASSGIQNLILVETEPDKIDIPVTKEWSSDSTETSNRPSSITVKLLANGNNTGKTLTLTSSGSWTGTFKELDLTDSNGNEIDYSVQEDTVTGYRAPIITGDKTTGFKITNTLEFTQVRVSKVWSDDSDRDGKRPTSAIIKLYANGEDTGKSVVLQANSTNATLNWKQTFWSLPKYKNGQLVEYTVKEEPVPSGYTVSIGGTQSSGYTITNTHEPIKTEITIEKVWDDDNNRDGMRPESIIVQLYADNVAVTGKTKTLGPNNWKATFDNLDKYKAGKEIVYTVKETVVPSGYTGTEGNSSNGYKITNTHVVEKISIPVEKVWDDEDDRDGKRPGSITVELYANNSTTALKTLILDESKNWKGEFSDLYKYENGQLITYTIKEKAIDSSRDYEVPVIKPQTVKGTAGRTNNKTSTVKVTNTHIPEKIEIPVAKEWYDKEDLDEYRPASITVKLFANGKDTGKTLTLNESRKWTGKFTDLYKYENGSLITYTIQEVSVSKYTTEMTPEYIKGTPGRENVTTEGFTITNKHEPHYEGYIEITGKVWLDGAAGKGADINGTYGSEDKPFEGIKVILKDASGNQFDETSTAVTDADGNYTIRVNLDTNPNVYKLHADPTTDAFKTKLDNAYVEFEYDGMLYTTVKTAETGANTSKAIEDEEARNKFDEKYQTVTSETKHANDWAWEDKKITAITENVIKSFNTYLNQEGNKAEKSDEVTLKYCKGDGSYIRTNPEGSWNTILPGTNGLECTSGTGHSIKKHNVPVIEIKNVNLGLFEREQPTVGLLSDISKVEVSMQGQDYTFLHGNRTEVESSDLHINYQDKYNDSEMEYYRPLNPADIAYNKDKELLTVDVYYELKVKSYSPTLPITVNSIINDYDSEYVIESVLKEKRDENGNPIGEPIVILEGEPDGAVQIIENGSGKTHKRIILNNLNITAQPKDSSDEVIIIKYNVSKNAIQMLLDEESTLNNASEVNSYSTTYGSETLYAEQQKGGRTNTPYGGYDYMSHPGNAGIKLVEVQINAAGEKGYRLKSTENLVTYVNGKTGPEYDTDIAPSFVLYKDEETRRLSGHVWEDTDFDNGSGPENYRLGNGKFDNEKYVGNVKVELCKYNENGELVVADLYKIENGEVKTKQAVTWTSNEDANRGYYSFGDDEYSVVTDVYLIRFTYGDGIDGSTTSLIDNTTVDARNYKSTIISSENTNLYNVFKGTSASEEWHLNIPKGTSIAVDDMEQRLTIPDLKYDNFEDKYTMTAYSKMFKMQVEYNPSENKQSQVSADGKTQFGHELNVFDFGIIERAREDIFVQTTVEWLKVTLSNGNVLIDGNPNEPGLQNVNAVGVLASAQNGEQAKSALEKQIIVTLDTEYIGDAQLELKYAIAVTNNSEKDYECVPNNADGTYNVANDYYYYGETNAHTKLASGSVNYVVDYLDSELEYKFENEEDWTKVEDIEAFAEQGFISANTAKAVKEKGYVAYTTTKFGELAPGDTSEKEYLTASKILANQNENVYDNHAEILQIDANTARTLKQTGIIKEYKTGNYVPGRENREIYIDDNEKTVFVPVGAERDGLHEQDDDRIKVVIQPPTGATNYITTYVIAGLAGLIVMVVGIVFIKKKVLTK